MSITVVAEKAAERADEILTEEALAFVERLHRRFAARRAILHDLRVAGRRQIEAGRPLDFRPETRSIRESDWRIAEAPEALRDRRVEITGPATPAKLAINALNSGARVWLADLEDASTPTWANIVDALLNLRDGALATLNYTSPEGKEYRLRDDIARPVVIVRPRGWHLSERHLEIDGERAIGALVDFGLHFFHTVRPLLEAGHGPYYYLPKMESHLEARLWNEIFVFAQEDLRVPRGTIRATVLIETIQAAFEMDEILFELREHASGLNAGRWDYLFSIVKTFRDAGSAFVLPDRSGVSMTAPFLRAYTDLLVATCHRRGAFALGGMAAIIPNRKDPAAAAVALSTVRADKDREAGDGFDGSWVAHPDLVDTCREAFDVVLGTRPDQLDRKRPEVHVTAEQLVDIASAGGVQTERGLRENISVAIAYTEAWLSGRGAVSIRGLMEDAATAEISRSQVWQQLQRGVLLSDTQTVVTPPFVRAIIVRETRRLREETGGSDHHRLDAAVELVSDLIFADELGEFLTIPAYEMIE